MERKKSIDHRFIKSIIEDWEMNIMNQNIFSPEQQIHQWEITEDNVQSIIKAIKVDHLVSEENAKMTLNEFNTAKVYFTDYARKLIIAFDLMST